MNFKPAIFASAIFFVLSFFVALISGAGFGISLLRAFITALCFGVLAVGIHFVYEKFLNDSSSENSSSDNQSESSSAPIGNKVDIVIDDEELEDDENSPKFVLTGQNQMLNKGDVQNNSKQGFVNSTDTFTKNEFENVSPLKNDQAVSNAPAKTSEEKVSKTETSSKSSEETSSFKPVPLVKQSAPSQSQSSEEFPPIEDTLGENSFLNDKKTVEEGDVDVLPDMGIAGVGKPDDTVTDSEFASGGKSTSRLNETVFPDGAKADSKDSSLMAEAIRTILRNEE
ncbi:MAG: hypothetical protein KBT21_11695 [Treponema sp.]|nr:hypothetical protein [Candidatus Treponema merdequi]